MQEGGQTPGAAEEWPAQWHSLASPHYCLAPFTPRRLCVTPYLLTKGEYAQGNVLDTERLRKDVCHCYYIFTK